MCILSPSLNIITRQVTKVLANPNVQLLHQRHHSPIASIRKYIIINVVVSLIGCVSLLVISVVPNTWFCIGLVATSV